jgi:hypothetical protein
MNDQDRTSFDPRIADWLEDDPNIAPEPALKIVLAAFPSIRQRHATRLPWRFPSMSTMPKLALGATAVFAVVLGGSAIYFGGPQQHAGGPPPSPIPSATSAPSSAPSAGPPSPQAVATGATDLTTYASSRFAYTIDYPASWSLTPAVYDWPKIGLPEKGGQTTDVYRQMPSGIQVYVTSVPVTPAKDAATLLADFDSENTAFCNETSNRHSITLDEVAMRQEDQVCAQTIQVVEVLGASKDRFFEINLVSSPDGSPLSDVDRETFARLLASFRFGG